MTISVKMPKPQVDGLSAANLVNIPKHVLPPPMIQQYHAGMTDYSRWSHGDPQGRVEGRRDYGWTQVRHEPALRCT